MNFDCTARRRRTLLALLVSCATLLPCEILLGQATLSTGAIRGIVSDPAGAAIANAKVVITNKQVSRVIQVVTSDHGMYASGPLQAGDYSLRVSAKGFKTVELAALVRVGEVTNGSTNLQKGPENAVARQVATIVNTEQSTVQTVLQPSQMDLLPISGRNYLDLAQFVPGIQFQDGGIIDASKNGLSSISFDSRYGRAERIEVDGVDVSDETVGTTTQNIAPSAIQEFNLARSSLDLPTELTSSGGVNISTRSGGNDLHGEAFGFFRGYQTAATLPGFSTPAASRYQREQFGARAGGVVIKDKLFWFVDAERTQQNLTAPEPFAAPFNTLSTSLAQPFRELLGDGRLDWQGRKDTHAFYRLGFDEVSQIRPFGAFSSLQGFRNALHSPSNTLGYDFTQGNYTHSIRFEYLRMADGVADVTWAIPAGIDNPVPGLGINIGAPVDGNCAQSSGGAFCGGPSQFAPQVTFQTDYQVKYDGSRMMGDHLFRYGATLNHVLVGQYAALTTSPQVGTTSICLPGSTVANCVTSAAPTAYQADFVSLSNGLGFSTPQSAFGYSGGALGPDNRIEAYLGDAWKYRQNFTMTFGVRYLHDTGRLDSNLAPISALNKWQPGLANQVRNPNLDLAPQFGIAWDPGNNGKTVVRGGAGLYYENSLWSNMLADSRARRAQGLFTYTPQVCVFGVPAPFTWPTKLGAVGSGVAGGAGVVVAGTNQVEPTFCGETISKAASDILALSDGFKTAAYANTPSQPNPNFVGTSLSAVNANGFDVFNPNYRTPRSYQMNLGLQHEVAPGTVFTADYVRNISEHDLLIVDANHSGAARSYNLANAIAARDKAQTNAATLYHGTQNCPAGLGEVQCMISSLGSVAAAQAAYSAAGLDSNSATTGGAPCSFCAFPGITPYGTNFTGVGGNGALGTLDMLSTAGRAVYSGWQVRLVQRIQNPVQGVKTANIELSYTYSKFISQGQDLDSPMVATDNDDPLRFTGPNGMDRRQQISFGGTLDLPFYAKLSLVGHFYSPLAQSLLLPELTNGGEIFASDWLGTGLGSGGAPEPVQGTQIGEFMRGHDISALQTIISNYNTHFAGTLTPAGHCLVGDGLCPGSGPIEVMTPADMSALGWVMPQVSAVGPFVGNFPWLKTLDVRASWPIKIRDRFTVQPSASFFNVFNFYNAFLPGNLPVSSLVPGGSIGTLAPYAVGGVMGGGSTPFRNSLQSGTFSLGAPREIEFGLRIEF